MAVKLNSPAINLRSLLARVMSWKPAKEYDAQAYSLVGNTTGRVDVNRTGWKPVKHGVYLNGAIQEEGLQYDKAPDGLGNWHIQFVTIPASTGRVIIRLERQP